MGRKKRIVCVRKYMSSHALCFPFRLYEEGSPSLYVPNMYPGRGEKEAGTGLHTRHCLSSGTAIASSTRRKFRKLLIPKYQLLLFSFQLSFINWFRDTLSLSRGDVPRLTPISPTADREASSSPSREGKAGGHQQGHA